MLVTYDTKLNKSQPISTYDIKTNKQNFLRIRREHFKKEPLISNRKM